MEPASGLEPKGLYSDARRVYLPINTGVYVYICIYVYTEIDICVYVFLYI